MGDQESFCLRQMLQEKHLRAASSKWRIQENARGEGYYGVCEMGFQAVRHRKLHPCNWMDEGRRSLRYVDGVAGLYRPGQAVGHPTTTLCRSALVEGSTSFSMPLAHRSRVFSSKE